MAIVRLKQVSKRYQQNSLEVHALSNVNLDIMPGEFVSLVGPSGSGKTTLLNLIGALDVPSEGNIWIENRDISQLSKAELALLRLQRLGFIFQEYNLIPVLSALENVEYVMLLQGVDEAERRQRAADMLHKVGLGDMLHRRPAELSGGQQQRVAVARAIVSEPIIVLADEPTANLDSITGAALLDLMRQLNDKLGITFVFSTHDSMVIERAKRIVRLKDGKIIDDKQGEFHS